MLWSSLFLESPVTFFDISSTGASDTGISGQQDPSTEHAHSPRDFRPTTARRNSDGDVKSLIASSDENNYSPGTSFRDDTNSDLYLAKSRSCKSSSEASKFPGNGLILNGVLENSNHISDKDSKLCCETPPGETEGNVFEGSEEECLKNGELGDSLTSSSRTVVEDPGCPQDGLGDNGDEQSAIFTEESLNSENGTVNPNVVSYNGDCSNLNGGNSEISKTLDSHLNGHSFDDDDASDATIVQDLTMKDSLDLSNSSNDLPYNKIKKLLDVDGLTIVVEPVQARLLELERSYRGQIDDLHTQLQTQGCQCEPRSRLISSQELVCQPFPFPLSPFSIPHFLFPVPFLLFPSFSFFPFPSPFPPSPFPFSQSPSSFSLFPFPPPFPFHRSSPIRCFFLLAFPLIFKTFIF